MNYKVELETLREISTIHSHIWMQELDHKEGWVPKNWCFWTVVSEKTLESPLDYNEIQPVHPTGNQSWIFIRRTDVEAETPILWPPDAKSWLIGKDPDAGKDWRQEKGTTGGWDVWMASLTQWTWVWASSRRQWRTDSAAVHRAAKSWTQLSDYILTFFFSALRRWIKDQVL